MVTLYCRRRRAGSEDSRFSELVREGLAAAPVSGRVVGCFQIRPYMISLRLSFCKRTDRFSFGKKAATRSTGSINSRVAPAVIPHNVSRRFMLQTPLSHLIVPPIPPNSKRDPSDLLPSRVFKTAHYPGPSTGDTAQSGHYTLNDGETGSNRRTEKCKNGNACPSHVGVTLLTD
jgi:hypothetical protein